MEILELAARIDKSSKNEDIDFIFDGILINQFGISETIQSKDNTRLKSYWLLKWYCTDTYVGRKLYFFDDKLVAMSYQPGRKCDEKFYWTSQEDFKNVKQYLLSLLQPEDIDILDLSKNYGLGESIEYVEQLLTNKVIYQGLICNVINKNIQNNTICLAEVGWVSIHNIIVPYELNKHKEME